jgi:hypothetical protein
VRLDAPSYHIPGLLPSHVQTMYRILSCIEDSVAAAVINSLVDQIGTAACLCYNKSDFFFYS